MTGYVAEQMGRRWISLELREEYLEGSKFRFADVPPRAEEAVEDAAKPEDQLPIFSREN